MSDRSTDGAEESTTNDVAGGSFGTNRRRFVKFVGASAAIGAVGGAAFTSNIVGAQSTANFGPDSGFADTGWFDDSVQVIRVTEATRSALESAIQTSGPRLIVFETSGTIDLGTEPLVVTEDYCWIAGQTAPSPGITLVQGLFQVDANNVVVQHIRSRVGPGSDGSIQGNDAMNNQDETQNVIFDHCTSSWGVDECMSVGYDSDRTTFSNCLIVEPLWNPYGEESDHTYCTLIGDGADHVALVGNIWAKARNRVPRLKPETRTVIANNLAYFIDEAANGESSSVTTFVGNHYAGVTQPGEPIVEGGTGYAADNLATPSLDSDTPFADSLTDSSRPLWPSGLETMPVEQVESHNLANAGARPADRTANDTRIIREIANRAGNDRLTNEYDYWVPDLEAVGGYPQLPENSRSLSVPSGGLRQWLQDMAADVEGGSAGTPWPTPESTPTPAPTDTPANTESPTDAPTDTPPEEIVDPGQPPVGGGTATVEGGGEDIWGGADEFHYFHASVGGDFDLVTRVDSLENTDGYAKAGLMVRESTAADAANVMVRKTPGNDTSIQWRPSAGDDARSLTSDQGSGESEIDGGTIAADWQRLVRVGDTIQAYASQDGSTWTLLTQLSGVSLSSTVQVGLAVTSHSAGTLCTAEFSNIAGFTPTNSQDVGAVDVAGSATGSFGGGGGPSQLSDGSQPQDLNGDGMARDVNGNGRLDNDDVVTYFEHMNDAAISNNPSWYDYNGNGRIDFDDLVTLFESL